MELLDSSNSENSLEIGLGRAPNPFIHFMWLLFFTDTVAVKLLVFKAMIQLGFVFLCFVS